MESRYWKEFLIATASDIRRTSRPPRLTQRRYEITERNVVISFFVLRRLIELHKVSRKVREFRLNVFAAPLAGKLPTLLNNHRVEELYDFSSEYAQTKTSLYICNQFVHSYSTSLVIDTTRNWDSILTVSDYDRKNCIWRIPMDVVGELLRMASANYVSAGKLAWNESAADYEIETD